MLRGQQMKKVRNKDKNMEVDHKDIKDIFIFIVDLSWERNRKKDRNRNRVG